MSEVIFADVDEFDFDPARFYRLGLVRNELFAVAFERLETGDLAGAVRALDAFLERSGRFPTKALQPTARLVRDHLVTAIPTCNEVELFNEVVARLVDALIQAKG